MGAMETMMRAKARVFEVIISGAMVYVGYKMNDEGS